MTSGARRRWVVVGGGTAGCVVAAELARRHDFEVVVVERGTEQRRHHGSSTLADAGTGGPWTTIEALDDGAARRYLCGTGVGGSSLISGAVVALDTEPAASVPGPLAPAVERVADTELGAVDRALLAAAPDAGRVQLLRRGGDLLGLGAVVGFGAVDAVADRGNLAEPEPRAGASVAPGDGADDDALSRVAWLTGAARALRLAGRRATGVELADGRLVEADAVVLCAGAIGSAALLLGSGVRASGLGAVRNHAGRMFDLVLRPGAGDDGSGLVTGAILRRGAAEVVAMNHLGPALPGHGGLLVGWLAGSRRGAITLTPDGSPHVDFGDLDGTADAAGLAVAEGIATSLLDDPAFGEIVVDWRPAATLGGYFHAGSSCAIGTSADDDGCLAGYEGLFVADAAALPDLPVGGMLAAVVAQASALARRWRATG